MPRLFLLLFVCFSSFVLKCQTKEWVAYLELQILGQRLYNEKDYVNAEFMYKKMDSLKSGFVFNKDLDRYIRCLIQNDKEEELLPYLLKYADTKSTHEENFNDSIFNKIKNKNYWVTIDSILNVRTKLCVSFTDSLAKMAEKDQHIRQLYLYELDTVEIRIDVMQQSKHSVIALMKEIDEENLRNLKTLIDIYGFPTWELVGETGSYDAWLIAQHAPDEFQEWYLYQLEKAVEENNSSCRNLAYLIDRVKLHRKEPQLYGTQYLHSGKFRPVEDIENLNFRREKMKMSPLNIDAMEIADGY